GGGNSPTPISTRARAGSTTNARKTRCSSTPTSPKRRGSSSKPTTRSARGSTASRICSRRSRGSRSRNRRSSSRHASPTTATSDRRGICTPTFPITPPRCCAKRSHEVVDDVGHALPDPRDERHLHLHVAPRLRLAQPADHLDDRVERGRLEGQDPLPVAQSERVRRIAEHLGELSPRRTVIPEQGGPLLLRKEVPLRRPHERIHAQVRPRRISLDERGPVIGRELRRLDDPHERPREGQPVAQLGPPELDDGALELLGGTGRQPQHQVGAGSEPHGRIGAAHADVAPPALEELLDLAHGAGSVLLVGEPVSQLPSRGEDRIEGVDRLDHAVRSLRFAVTKSAAASATSVAPRTHPATWIPS